MDIRIAIVDDEPACRGVLRNILRRDFPDVQVIGEAGSVAEGMDMLQQETPDLLLLDVEMPGKSGFDLLADLRKVDLHPAVIFQTAFDHYAIRAIKNSAFDYLLKPVDQEALLEALARFRSSGRLQRLDEKIDALCHHLDRHRKIRFNTRQGFILVDPTEIAYCLADWNYTELHLADGARIVVTLNIGKIEETLDPTHFIRISRSVIINRNFLKSVDKKKRQCLLGLPGKEMAFSFPAGQGKRLGELGHPDH